MSETENTSHAARDPLSRVAVAVAVIALAVGAVALGMGIRSAQSARDQVKATELAKLREALAKNDKELASHAQRLEAMSQLAEELGKQVRESRNLVTRLQDSTRVATTVGAASSAQSVDELRQSLGQLDTTTIKHTEQLKLLKDVLEEHLKWHRTHSEVGMK